MTGWKQEGGRKRRTSFIIGTGQATRPSWLLQQEHWWWIIKVFLFSMLTAVSDPGGWLMILCTAAAPAAALLLITCFFFFFAMDVSPGVAQHLRATGNKFDMMYRLSLSPWWIVWSAAVADRTLWLDSTGDPPPGGCRRAVTQEAAAADTLSSWANKLSLWVTSHPLKTRYPRRRPGR